MRLWSAPEFKVGLFVLIVSGIIGGMSLRAGNSSNYLGPKKESWFYIDDASGLVKGSGVKTAGIDVGTIKDIKLENGQAKVEMSLKGDLPLTKSARIEIRPNGILGDKHVEIVAGDPRDPPLRSGEQILVVDDRASVDRLIAEVSKITKSLSEVAENVKSATEGDADKPLGRIINHIETITGDLAELTQNKKREVGEIIDNVHDITQTFDDFVNDDGPDGFKQAVNGALKSLKRIESSLKNVDEITGKINRGEGTIGKLVNDDTTVEQINTAIDGINNFIDAGSKLQTSIDFHSAYLTSIGQPKSILNLRVQPGLDRYYEVGIVSDPMGLTDTIVTQSNTNGVQSTTNETKTYENKVKFNALFAKNFYDFTVKGGIIESSGGAGLDYYLLKRRLMLSVEGFGFSGFDLRASARYTVFSGLYVTAGGENLTSNRGDMTAFVGAGLLLTNDDLKLFLSKMPF